MEPDSTFGRYILRHQIGEGAMATVYEAYDPLTDRSIALKVLKSEQRSDQGLVRRFLEEARAAGALSHPNIVAYYDVGTEEGIPYITLEIMRGPSLEQLLAKEARLDFQTSTRILSQIAEALDHAHDLGRVHRDVKPSNILLTADLKTAKLTDFGVARIERTDAAAVTQVGEIIGTPRYMSPEQIEGSAIDGRTDLFCLGVVAYEMLTGKKAFEAESLPALLAQISQQDPIPLNELAPDVPAEAADVISRMMAKAPGDRWPSGRAFISALTGSGTISRQGRQDVNEDGRKPVWARLPVLLAGGLGVVASIAILWLYLAPIQDAKKIATKTKPTPTEAPARKDPEIAKAEPDTPKTTDSERVLPTINDQTAASPTPTPEAMIKPNVIWPDSWQASWLRVPASLQPGTCQWLEQVRGGGSTRILGVATDEAGRRSLIANLQTNGTTDGVEIEIEPQSSSICRLTETIAGRALPAPHRMVHLEPDLKRMAEGDQFKIMIDAPKIDSHVSVHYLDAEGTVHHLFPSDYQTKALVQSGRRVAVMALEGMDRWEVGPPLGREAILLLAGIDRPLLSINEASEPIDMFTRRLDAALTSAGHTSRPLASLLVIETSAR